MSDAYWWLDAAAGEARRDALEPYDDRPTRAEAEADERESERTAWRDPEPGRYRQPTLGDPWMLPARPSVADDITVPDDPRYGRMAGRRARVIGRAVLDGVPTLLVTDDSYLVEVPAAGEQARTA